ncbi:MAG: hypothetical protein P4L53_06190 [Candidatus Obscuribacterales bacterium]|nr:hypothetical protein [Candidatus Obscuribacterales bacterium]
MTNKKRVLSIAIGGACGLGLLATSSFANPILPPVVAPVPVSVSAPTVSPAPMKTQLLNTYRQVRTFWLSRAIVR